MSAGILNENAVRSESNKYSMIPILFSGEGLFEPELGSAEDGGGSLPNGGERSLCKRLGRVDTWRTRGEGYKRGLKMRKGLDHVKH